MLLWLTLIYPCIWVWQRLHPRGGGPYSVAKIHCESSVTMATLADLPQTA
jgi:hypothetical protein